VLKAVAVRRQRGVKTGRIETEMLIVAVDVGPMFGA
jgi:hypothetical protein